MIIRLQRLLVTLLVFSKTKVTIAKKDSTGSSCSPTTIGDTFDSLPTWHLGSMGPRGDDIPSTFRLWIFRILWQRRRVVFSIFGVTVITLFLLVSPPDISSILPRPWQPHMHFGDIADISPVEDEVWAERAQAVKRAFIHAYEPYESIAFPSDELLPISKLPINKQVSHSCGSSAPRTHLVSPC